jgi:hypothetical protein
MSMKDVKPFDPIVEDLTFKIVQGLGNGVRKPIDYAFQGNEILVLYQKIGVFKITVEYRGAVWNREW